MEESSHIFTKMKKWITNRGGGGGGEATRQQKIYVDQQLCLLTEIKFYTIITRSLKWKKEIWQSKREHHLGADSYNVFKWISKHIFLGKLVEQMGPKLLCLLNPEKPLSESGNSPNRTMRAQERTVIGKLYRISKFGNWVRKFVLSSSTNVVSERGRKWKRW